MEDCRGPQWTDCTFGAGWDGMMDGWTVWMKNGFWVFCLPSFAVSFNSNRTFAVYGCLMVLLDGC